MKSQDALQESVAKMDRNLATVEKELRARKRCLVCAESCTGGMLAQLITDHAGSSDWFYGSFVTYQLIAKKELLGISDHNLALHGPVSHSTAMAMAKQSLALTSADYAISLTGLAGPDGDGSSARVGELWIGWGETAAKKFSTQRYEIHAARSDFRLIACALAIEGLLGRILKVGTDG